MGRSRTPRLAHRQGYGRDGLAQEAAFTGHTQTEIRFAPLLGELLGCLPARISVSPIPWRTRQFGRRGTPGRPAASRSDAHLPRLKLVFPSDCAKR